MTLLHRFPFPLIAILRGLTPQEAGPVGAILFEAGFQLLEVPLNRPGALDCIRQLRDMAPAGAQVGAGTVLSLADVDAAAKAGGQFMVAPNAEPAVIRHAVQAGMLVMPGVATPSEGFRALEAGAAGLKLFPAEMMPPAVVKAWASVFPAGTALLPVGGIHPGNMAAYVDAGATGFGIGSGLYRPGVDLATLGKTAETYMELRRSMMQMGT